MVKKSTIYDAIYGRFFYAGLYDWFLSRGEAAGLSRERRLLLARAAGRVLEVGAGTGLNLPHYPPTVAELILTEPYPHMLSLLRRKVASLGLKISAVQAAGESLPFPEASFDTVVATFVLCTATEPERVLGEIYRILRPGGQYIFFEHVISPDPRTKRLQNFIQPFWYYFANGCRCNQDTETMIKNSPLIVNQLTFNNMPKFPKIVAPMIRGVAIKPTA